MPKPLLSFAVLLLLLNSRLVPAAAPSLPSPSPQLGPREVVQLQLAALQAVDSPSKDAGFATVFRFSSPENRAQTGPLPRFSKMIREGFGEMINHKKAVLLPVIQEAGKALQPVELTSLGGQTYRYVFVLRKQDLEDCQGCWLTDGVIPQDAGAGNSSQEL